MRVLRNTGQNISPSDDGRLFDQAFTDGLFNSPSITSLGSNLVQIGAMYGILCGRDFTSDAQQVTVALSDSGTKTGHIYIRFDTTTADIISIESVIGSYTPTYTDINTTGTVAEMEIATYTATVLAVTAITPNYPKAQTEVNETLAGSIATIETSPATANHAVGEYIVYNGQLYKVTTAITAGQSLTVGTNISAVNVGDQLSVALATGYTEATTLSGMTSSLNQLNRVGSLCMLSLNVNVTTAISAWSNGRIVIPSEFRPSRSQNMFIAYKAGSTVAVEQWQVLSDGNVRCGANIPTGALYVTLTYFIV